jgi:hypothetical protein
MATYTEHNSAAPATLETNRIEWFVGPKFGCDGPLQGLPYPFAIKDEQSEREDQRHCRPLREQDFRFAEASSEAIDH